MVVLNRDIKVWSCLPAVTPLRQQQSSWLGLDWRHLSLGSQDPSENWMNSVDLRLQPEASTGTHSFACSVRMFLGPHPRMPVPVLEPWQHILKVWAPILSLCRHQKATWRARRVSSSVLPLPIRAVKAEGSPPHDEKARGSNWKLVPLLPSPAVGQLTIPPSVSSHGLVWWCLLI